MPATSSIHRTHRASGYTTVAAIGRRLQKRGRTINILHPARSRRTHSSPKSTYCSTFTPPCTLTRKTLTKPVKKQIHRRRAVERQ